MVEYHLTKLLPSQRFGCWLEMSVQLKDLDLEGLEVKDLEACLEGYHLIHLIHYDHAIRQ